jgi:tetratricopeptide (TPR) repeat protein
MPKVFISHTHSDKAIADALSKAVRSLFGTGVQVEYSTKKELGGGIPHGDNWFDWIVDQVTEADIALVLLTPGSIQKPWILWEAGAIAGVAMAAERNADPTAPRLRKVRPLVFHLKTADIPSPFHHIQLMRGDSQQDAELLFRDLMDVAGESFDHQAAMEAGRKLRRTIKTYLKQVSAAILRAPLLVSEPTVQEWLDRLDRFEKRPSEIDQLYDWMKVAFGRGDEDEDRPLDLRIHRRLGELYSRRDTLESRRRALHELALARQLAPRDIFILRQQGNACIMVEEYDQARDVISEIEHLDPRAFERNIECAALRGKWLRRTSDPQAAIAVFATALRNNKDSYYLANLAAEASLEAGDRDKAREYYGKSLTIIESLHEENIWTWASAANASFALRQYDKAELYVSRIAAAQPSNEEISSIEGGLRLVQTQLGLPEDQFVVLCDILQGRIP